MDDRAPHSGVNPLPNNVWITRSEYSRLTEGGAGYNWRSHPAESRELKVYSARRSSTCYPALSGALLVKASLVI